VQLGPVRPPAWMLAAAGPGAGAPRRGAPPRADGRSSAPPVGGPQQVAAAPAPGFADRLAPTGAHTAGRGQWEGPARAPDIPRTNWRRRHGPGQGPVEAATAIRVLGRCRLRPLPAPHDRLAQKPRLMGHGPYGFRFAAPTRIDQGDLGLGVGRFGQGIPGKPPPCRIDHESAGGGCPQAAACRARAVLELGNPVVVAPSTIPVRFEAAVPSGGRTCCKARNCSRCVADG